MLSRGVLIFVRGVFCVLFYCNINVGFTIQYLKSKGSVIKKKQSVKSACALFVRGLKFRIHHENYNRG